MLDYVGIGPEVLQACLKDKFTPTEDCPEEKDYLKNLGVIWNKIARFYASSEFKFESKMAVNQHSSYSYGFVYKTNGDESKGRAGLALYISRLYPAAALIYVAEESGKTFVDWNINLENLDLVPENFAPVAEYLKSILVENKITLLPKEYLLQDMSQELDCDRGYANDLTGGDGLVFDLFFYSTD